jgi:steroid 5-alpha reductase family enzyme
MCIIKRFTRLYVIFVVLILLHFLLSPAFQLHILLCTNNFGGWQYFKVSFIIKSQIIFERLSFSLWTIQPVFLFRNMALNFDLCQYIRRPNFRYTTCLSIMFIKSINYPWITVNIILLNHTFDTRGIPYQINSIGCSSLVRSWVL